MQLLSLLCYAIAFCAWLFIVIEAFRDEVWKGVACLFCGIYALYYAAREWDHPQQWLVLWTLVIAGVLARMLPLLAAMQQVGAS
jgi:hypothetical protein